MHVSGINAHATYVVVAVVSNDGGLVQKPLRIKNSKPHQVGAVHAMLRTRRVWLAGRMKREGLVSIIHETIYWFV